MTEAEPESYTTEECENSDDGVVPDKVRIRRNRSECLSNGSSKCAHEKVDRHDHGLHVGRSFGVSVLERRDVGEDFGNTNENIRQDLCPDVDIGLAEFFDTVWITRILSARRFDIDEVLHHCSSKHRSGSEEESKCHTLDRGERDTRLAESRVDAVVQNWNHDNDRDWVEVLDNIIGHTIELQGSGLGCQISSHLVVSQLQRLLVHFLVKRSFLVNHLRRTEAKRGRLYKPEDHA